MAPLVCILPLFCSPRENHRDHNITGSLKDFPVGRGHSLKGTFITAKNIGIWGLFPHAHPRKNTSDEGNSPLWYHSCHKDPGAFSPGKFWNYLLSTRVLICSILRTLFSHFRRSTTEFKVFNWQHYIHLI